LGVDEIGELERVPYEENWGIISYHVIVAVFSIELDRKAARITFGIGRPFFSAHGREAHKYISTLSNL
jgi:hypothetical protein